jgi:hypothetical protein
MKVLLVTLSMMFVEAMYIPGFLVSTFEPRPLAKEDAETAARKAPELKAKFPDKLVAEASGLMLHRLRHFDDALAELFPV